MITVVDGPIPTTRIAAILDSNAWEGAVLELRFQGAPDDVVRVRLAAKDTEVARLFSAIHAAINPAPSELSDETAEYEETRKVTVCEGCGVVHG